MKCIELLIFAVIGSMIGTAVLVQQSQQKRMQNLNLV